MELQKNMVWLGYEHGDFYKRLRAVRTANSSLFSIWLSACDAVSEAEIFRIKNIYFVF